MPSTTTLHGTLTVMPKFHFDIPGQPPSWNHSYRYARGRVSKAEGVENYQLVAAVQARRAKPKDFAPNGMLYVRYWLHLKRDQDATNVLKIVEDGIAVGLGVNDRMFLPAVLFKEHGVAEPSISVEVEYNQ